MSQEQTSHREETPYHYQTGLETSQSAEEALWIEEAKEKVKKDEKEQESTSIARSLFSVSLWYSLCVLMHVLFGIQPVFSRYLQTVVSIPTLGLISVTNGTLLIFVIPMAIYKFLKNIGEINGALRKIDEQYVGDFQELFRQNRQHHWFLFHCRNICSLLWTELKLYLTMWPIIPILFLILVSTVCAFYSNLLTHSAYVQLVHLFLPFFVLIFSSFLLGGEANEEERNLMVVDLRTIVACGGMIIGGILLILGLDSEGEWFSLWIDFERLASGFSWLTALGLLLAIVSTSSEGLHQVYTQYSSSITKFQCQQEVRNYGNQKQTGPSQCSEEEGGDKFEPKNIIVIDVDPHTGVLSLHRDMRARLRISMLSFGNIFILQEIILSIIPIIPSILIRENWGIYLSLSVFDWVLLVSFGWFVLGASHLLNHFCIEKLGVMNVVSLSAVRFTSTIVFSAVMLREGLRNLVEIAGALLIITTLVVFMTDIRRREKAKSNHLLLNHRVEISEKVKEETISSHPVTPSDESEIVIVPENQSAAKDLPQNVSE